MPYAAPVYSPMRLGLSRLRQIVSPQTVAAHKNRGPRFASRNATRATNLFRDAPRLIAATVDNLASAVAAHKNRGTRLASRIAVRATNLFRDAPRLIAATVDNLASAVTAHKNRGTRFASRNVTHGITPSSAELVRYSLPVPDKSRRSMSGRRTQWLLSVPSLNLQGALPATFSRRRLQPRLLGRCG